MRRPVLVSLLVVSCVRAALAAPAAPSAEALAAGTATPPTLRIGNDARPLRYRVDLHLVPSETTFRGTIEIDLDLARPTSLLWLNALEIEVDAATIAVAARGGRAEPVKVVPGGSDFLGFAFDTAAPAGPAVLRIDYRGRILDKETSGLFHQKDGDDWYLFSQLEATDARRAFPCFDEPGFKVPWQLTLHVPAGLVAASNTPVLSEHDGEKAGEAEGMKRVRFAATPPLPSYLVALAVGPFDVVDGGTAGEKKTPLRVLALRGRAAEVRHAFDTTRELLTRLEQYFGMPYPYEKLDQVALPETVGFSAMENPGLVTFNGRALQLKPEDDSVEQRRRYAGIQAHELAHMWFGDLVTLAWWDDIWLNEAFASWMGSKVVSAWKPEWGGDVARVRSRSRAMSADALVTARQVRQPIVAKDDIENAFDSITYSKGSSLLAMFEGWMGAERFQRGVRRYLARHAQGNATAADFLAALGAEGATEVPPAFSAFLDQPGVPLVSFKLDCGAVPPKLQIASRRFLPLGSRGGGGESWPVPVCVRYDAGKGGTGRECTLLTAAAAEIPLTAAERCPSWVLGNDGALGYYIASYHGDLLARLLEGGGAALSLTEKVAVLGEVSALVDAGELGYPEALGLVPGFAAAESRHLVASTARIVEGLRRHLVPPALKPSYSRFVCETYGGRARDLGLRPRPGEDEDVRLLRSSIAGLVALDGDDPAMVAEARVLAERWIEDRRAVDPDLVASVLEIAAAQGDAALFGRYLGEARKTRDRRDRSRLFAALGEFRDPALQKRALALVLDPEIDVRQVGGILYAGLDQPVNRAIAYDFVKDNWDAIVARFPGDSVARLVSVGSAFCDDPHLADVEAFFGPRLPQFIGGQHALDRALESMSLCIARKAAQGPGVAAFLEGY